MLVMDPAAYVPDRSLPAKIRRRLTAWRAAKPMTITPETAIISFTFDDFPKSAAQYGADALERVGAKGTFYACSGLAGADNVNGLHYDADDLAALDQAGHEIGTHTHTHLDCARIDAAETRAEWAKNTEMLRAFGHRNPAAHFAWPYGETTFANKRALADKVDTGRGILPGINRKGSDLMQLRSMELRPDDWTTQRAIRAIEDVAREPGWLTIFTHDVRANPGPFGTTPAALASVVQHARDSGAYILTMTEAFASLYGHGART